MTSGTLDSNVYISALQYDGFVARILKMARAGQVRVDTSPEILLEVIGVLRDKYLWDGYRLRATLEKLSRLANVVTPTETLSVVSDPDDNRIVECAVAAGSNYIVTRDKHLRKLIEYRGIAVVTPEQFANLVVER